jgi:hypothetical protein
VDPQSPALQRVVLAFWLACGLAAVGGVVPLLLTGTSGRVNGVIVPFGLAAIALAACAALYGQGRTFTSLIYFVAGLAIVFGILSLLAVPVRLSLVGTCPPSPAQCPVGFERPMTGAETLSLQFAIGMGIAAVLVGFFGLVALYRHLDAARPELPPMRRIPPVRDSRAAASAPVAAPEPTPTAAELPAPEPELELPAPEPQLELPAPKAEPELPAPEPELTPHVEPPEAGDAGPAPAPKPRPKRKRTPRAKSDSTPPTTSAT